MVKKSDLKRLNTLMEEGESLKNSKKYNKAIEKYLEAIQYVKVKVKDPEDQLEEVSGIEAQIDQIYSIEIMDELASVKELVDRGEFTNAIAKIEDTIRVAEKIQDEDLKTTEINDLTDWKIRTEIKEAQFQAEKYKDGNDFENGIKILEASLDKANIFYSGVSDNDVIIEIKQSIDNIHSANILLIIEKGNQAKVNNNYDEAISIYQKALKLTENIYQIDRRNTETLNIQNLINQIYSLLVKPIVEKAKELNEQEQYSDAASEFQKALSITDKMYDSEQKRNEIDKINSIASNTVNPKYLEDMYPFLEKGLNLKNKEDFKEDGIIVNQTVDSFYNALEIAEKMAISKEREQKLNEIRNLINEACKIRAEYLEEQSFQAIALKELDQALNQLYSAISIAKKMVLPEEENEILIGLKNSVNKIFINDAENILKEGVSLIEQKKFDEAIVRLNDALDTTNKMYLTQEMENMVNRIKGLIYQAELGGLVGKGSLTEEQERYEKEIEKLNKKMEYAQTIDDPDRRFQEIEKIKNSIDEIHLSEIKLLVEQASQLADMEQFEDAFGYFERAMKVNELIESPEFKNREAIKEKYKSELIHKAELHLAKEELDESIDACNKAIMLDSLYLTGYFTMGLAYHKKKKYEMAIDYFKKALDLDNSHAESWNHLGLAYVQKEELDQAILSYKKSVSFDSNYDAAFYNMANAYKKKGELDDAIESYKRAIEINPEHAKAWFFMGCTYFDKNEYHDAIRYLDKAIEIDPNLGVTTSNLITEFKKSAQELREKLTQLFLIE